MGHSKTTIGLPTGWSIPNIQSFCWWSSPFLESITIATNSYQPIFQPFVTRMKQPWHWHNAMAPDIEIPRINSREATAVAHCSALPFCRTFCYFWFWQYLHCFVVFHLQMLVTSAPPRPFLWTDYPTFFSLSRRSVFANCGACPLLCTGDVQGFIFYHCLYLVQRVIHLQLQRPD